MQILSSSSSLLSFALVLTMLIAAKPADAAECTEADLLKIKEVYSSAATSSRSTCLDVTEESSYCDNTDCLALMTKLMQSLPDCTASGFTFNKTMIAVLEYCDSLPSQSSDSTTDDTNAATSTAQLFMGMNVATLSLAAGIAGSLFAAWM